MGHDLNDIFNIQMRGLNFNSLAAADGRMEARSGVLVAMAAPPRICVKIFTAHYRPDFRDASRAPNISTPSTPVIMWIVLPSPLMSLILT